MISKEVEDIKNSYHSVLNDKQEHLNKIIKEWESIISPLRKEIEDLKSNRDKLIMDYLKELIGEKVFLPNGDVSRIESIRVSNKSGNPIASVKDVKNQSYRNFEYPISELKFQKDILDQKIESILKN